MNNANELAPGTRVTVLGRPGVVRYTCRDGSVGVRLDSEGSRVDEWHPSQVVAELDGPTVRAVARAAELDGSVAADLGRPVAPAEGVARIARVLQVPAAAVDLAYRTAYETAHRARTLRSAH